MKKSLLKKSNALLAAILALFGVAASCDDGNNEDVCLYLWGTKRRIHRNYWHGAKRIPESDRKHSGCVGLGHYQHSGRRQFCVAQGRRFSRSDRNLAVQRYRRSYPRQIPKRHCRCAYHLLRWRRRVECWHWPWLGNKDFKRKNRITDKIKKE